MALQREDRPTVLVEGVAFLARLAEEVKRSSRYRNPFTVLLLRPPEASATEELLTSDWLGSLAHGLVRGCDVIAVFEDEPMVAVLLPETGVSGAGALLDRIRTVIPDAEEEWEYTLLEYPMNRRKIERFMRQAA